jgi:hypothetical protein
MSGSAIVMMVFMIVVYFGGLIYFALKKEPKK